MPTIIYNDTDRFLLQSCYASHGGRLKHVETPYASEHAKNEQNGLFGDLSDVHLPSSTIIYHHLPSSTIIYHHPGVVFWAKVDV